MRHAVGADKFVEVNGLKLHYLEWGDSGNRPMVMLHGIASLAHIWDFIAPEFAFDYRVLALDWRGHGDSEWSSNPVYTYEDYVGDLEGVVVALGLHEVTLVGHSLGGYNALYYASRNPGRTRAVVGTDIRTGISPEEIEQSKQAGARPHKEISSRDEIIARFAASLAPTCAPKEPLESIGQHAIKETSPGKWIYKFDRKALAVLSVDPWQFLPQVKAPTLIMRGEGSPMMPRDGAQEMSRTIRGARLAELQGAYHHLFLDKPEGFVAEIRAFLSQLP